MKIISTPLYEKHRKRFSGIAITTKECEMETEDGTIFVPAGHKISFVLTGKEGKEITLSVSGEFELKKFWKTIKIKKSSFIQAVKWLSSVAQ